MSLSGDEATGPVRTGQPITDHMTGIYAAVGILAALHNRSVTGLGQHIDMALFDTLITTLGSTIPDYGCNGVVQKPWGNRDMVTPVNLYKTQQVKARDMIIQLDVEGAGKVPYPGMPIKLSDTPCSVHYENFQLGAATEDIMTNLLGYTQDEFHALRAAHIV